VGEVSLTFATSNKHDSILSLNKFSPPNERLWQVCQTRVVWTRDLQKTSFSVRFYPTGFVVWHGVWRKEEVNKKLAILKKKIFEEAEIMASKIDDLMHQLQEVFECSDLLISTSLGS
jgi:hypothetical protein